MTDKHIEGPANEQSKKLPDRPLECSECRKAIKVRYTEVVGDIINETSMCADCPNLHRHLHGGISEGYNLQVENGTGLACGVCGTTMEAIKVGTPLGCSVCYEVFDDLLIPEMIAADKISTRFISQRKGDLIHIGRTPGEITELSQSFRLLALNEALDETLKREDYEQAALLRDQIKALEIKELENKERKDG